MIDRLPDHARVWVYQNPTPLHSDQLDQVELKINEFLQSWSAHGHSLMAAAKIYHQRFIVIAVDEKVAAASGCSIDASVRFMQSLESQEGLNFFDRMHFSYRDESNKVVTISKDQLQLLADSKNIYPETLFFDTLVPTLGDLRKRWEKPLDSFWLKRMVKLPIRTN